MQPLPGEAALSRLGLDITQPRPATSAADIARRGGRVVLTGIPGEVSDAVSAFRVMAEEPSAGKTLLRP